MRLSSIGQDRGRRAPKKLAALALAPLLLLAVPGLGQAQEPPGHRFDCQVVLSSPQAGEVELNLYGDPLFATDNPEVRWTPASNGGPIGFILVFYKAPLTDLGPFQGGGVDFDVPAGADPATLSIVFATPDGGRWAFRPDKVEPADSRGGPVGLLGLDAGKPGTMPVLEALSSAASFTITVTADGQAPLETRFTLDRAARDALLARAGAMTEARKPPACKPNHSRR